MKKGLVPELVGLGEFSTSPADSTTTRVFLVDRRFPSKRILILDRPALEHFSRDRTMAWSPLLALSG
jgi:hypothetical protein